RPVRPARVDPEHVGIAGAAALALADIARHTLRRRGWGVELSSARRSVRGHDRTAGRVLARAPLEASAETRKARSVAQRPRLLTLADGGSTPMPRLSESMHEAARVGRLALRLRVEERESDRREAHRSDDEAHSRERREGLGRV